jgi:hypothetical protein
VEAKVAEGTDEETETGVSRGWEGWEEWPTNPSLNGNIFWKKQFNSRGEDEGREEEGISLEPNGEEAEEEFLDLDEQFAKEILADVDKEELEARARVGGMKGHVSYIISSPF